MLQPSFPLYQIPTKTPQLFEKYSPRMDIFKDDNSDDEKEIMQSTWTRMKKMHTTNGFREGALSGKDTQLQHSFDIGYADGFKKAYELGYNCGQERIQQFLTNKDGSNNLNKLKKSLETLCNTCNTQQS